MLCLHFVLKHSVLNTTWLFVCSSFPFQNGLLTTDTDFQNITLLHAECFTAVIIAETFYPANISYSVLFTDKNKAHLMNCKMAGLVVTIWDQSEASDCGERSAPQSENLIADIDWNCLLSKLLYLLNANIKFLEYQVSNVPMSWDIYDSCS